MLRLKTAHVGLVGGAATDIDVTYADLTKK